MSSGSLKDFISVVKKLLPSFYRIVLTLVGIVFVSEIIKLVPVYAVKILVDTLAETTTFRESIFELSILGVGLILTAIISILALTYIIHIVHTKQKETLVKVFDKLVTLPLSYHQKRNSGAQVSLITKASKYLLDLMWFLNNDIVPTVMQLIITTAMLFWIEWRIGLFFLIFTPFMIVLIEKQFKKVQPYREMYHKEYNKATAQLAQTLINMQTVKGYGNEQQEKKAYDGILARYLNFIKTRERMDITSWYTRDILIVLGRIVCICLAVYFYVHGSVTLGSVVLLITLVEKAYLNLNRLGRAYHFMGDTYEGLSSLAHILDEENVLIGGNKKPQNGDLTLENVTFAYNTKETALKNVTLTIPRGKVTALIGRSGSGKSTIAKLFSRQYDPQKGELCLAGVPLQELQLQQLRRKVLYVSQQTEIFDRTVLENIAYANPRATKKEVIAAAKKASAHGFITRFPKGYDTVVGESGVRLSGGQRQRIAIARALLAKPYMIIFDEATSALDTENEQVIQKAILAIKDTTVVIIAHRLSTVKHANEIVVMEEGRVIEQGSHNDLLRHKGVYKKMIELQKIGELKE